MIGRKNMDLVERILTALEEGPEVEDYAIDEIEVLPIEVVNARLQELGVDPTVPPAIMNFARRANTPAQRVIDALYEHDSEEDEEDEIELLDVNKVQAALHDAGLNYRAGVERIRQLTGASDHSEEPESPTPLGEAASGGNVEPFSAPILARASYTDTIVSEVSERRVFHQPAKPKWVLPWKVVVVTWAAMAATALLFIVDKNASSLKLENTALRSWAGAPLIKAEDAPIKVPPESPGGMDVPNRDILVYRRMQGTPGERPAVERLQPGPEQPLAPRPAQTWALVSPPVESPLASGPPGIEPSPAASATSAAKTAPPPQLAQARVPTAPATAAKPAQPGKLANRSGVQVQLLSSRSADEARNAWARLKDKNGDLLGTLSPTVARGDLGDRGTFYRLRAGPIADEAKARAICDSLAGRGVSCIIVQPSR